MTDEEIKALESWSTVEIDGKTHKIGTITYDISEETGVISQASFYSLTENRWVKLR
ncbi:hypothetical protein [Micromonospora sp. CB01531]|uniref:hypothetical protein n=1 Tax=Micromonospora sp. CB01531 TaxID=1718947 RepID=UPI000AFC23E0|nr:hypothetical protein [Micromonospora sp. CB01531]